MDKINNAIICACNKTKCGVLIKGHRHFDDTMRHQYKYQNIEWSAKDEQGFIDMYGKFKTRKEAMEIVKKSGQLFLEDRNGGNGLDLYSEGIY